MGGAGLGVEGERLDKTVQQTWRHRVSMIEFVEGVRLFFSLLSDFSGDVTVRQALTRYRENSYS